MKIITWKRPHLTAFGEHQLVPGENKVDYKTAAAMQAHWAWERAAKAGIVEIEDAKEIKADEPKPAVGGKGKKKGADSDA